MANVQLTWQGSSSAQYEVQYKASTDTGWTVLTSSPVTGNTVTINGLQDSTEYIFRVRDLCVGDSVSPWIYDTFTTGNPSCVAPAGLTLSNVSETAATLSWNASSSAIGGYIPQYRQDSSLSWISLPVTNALTVNFTPLTPNTLYDFRVIGVCAGSAQGTSAAVSATTLPNYTQCQLISAATVTITQQNGNSSYSATWSHTGGTPSTDILAYSTNGGASWNTLTSANILSQTLTSANYTLPSGAGGYPVTHLLKVTPLCPDNSQGTPATGSLTGVPTPTEYIVISNQVTGGTIPTATFDGGPNFLPSAIASGGTYNFNTSGLFSGNHNINATLGNVASGTYLTVQQIRGSSTLISGNLLYTNQTSVPLAVSQSFQNGDILRIVNTPKVNLPTTVTMNCTNGLCNRIGTGTLTFNFSSPTPTAFTLLIAYCTGSVPSHPGSCYGTDALNVPSPPAPLATDPNAPGTTTPFTVNIPAGVTSYTTPLLNAIDRNGYSYTTLDCYPTCNPNYGFGSVRYLYFHIVPPSNYNFSVTMTNSDITASVL